jgi:peptide/nickel transport system substrate-binding protein
LYHGRKVTVFLLITAVLLSLGCWRAKEKKPAQRVETGGQLIYGSLQEPTTANPLLSDLLSTVEVGRLVFSGLVMTDDKGEWISDLAADVPTRENGGVSPDGLTITYHLRPGVLWQDGTPFTSEDVNFTWQTLMNPKVNVVVRDGYNKITAVDTPDKNTVVVHFREYYAPYLTLFSTILPKHILKDDDINTAEFNRAPVGTGPFIIKEWRPGEAVILEANPNYYRGRPNLDTIVYKFLPQNSDIINQLNIGELDIVGNVPFSLLDQLKTLDGVRTVLAPGRIWEHLDLNLDNPLFSDVQVRRAIALGIDRQALADNVLKGTAFAAVGDQSPISWAYNPVAKVSPRDVNAARAILTQAGWMPGVDGIYTKNGRRLSFVLTTASDTTREAVAQLISQQLKEAGIEVIIQLVDVGSLFHDVLKKRHFEAVLYGSILGMDPENISLWNSKNIPEKKNGYLGQNYAGWRNSEVDFLTESGERTMDIDSRKQIYIRIQDLIVNEVPVVPLYFRSNIDAVSDTVVNYKPSHTPAGSLWNAWEWGMTKKK